MWRQQNVARQLFEQGKTPLKIAQHIWVPLVTAVSKGTVRDRRLAVGIHEVETSVTFARLPGPACAAWRVSGRKMRGECDAANRNFLAIGNDTNVLDPGKGIGFEVERILPR